jgi:hypothetical protein
MLLRSIGSADISDSRRTPAAISEEDQTSLSATASGFSPTLTLPALRPDAIVPVHRPEIRNISDHALSLIKIERSYRPIRTSALPFL